MKRHQALGLLASAALAVALAAGSPAAAQETGAVYVMTNSAEDNEIVVYDRDEEGLLSFRRTVPTGGRGSGGDIDPLGSQGALILSQNERWLFAVNARSNNISIFEVTPGGLTLIGRKNSGGSFPISLTQHGDLLYVLNAAEPNIRGFKIRDDGTLKNLGNSRRPLLSLVSDDGRASHPTQVQFDPEGRLLVITDLDTDEIHVYKVRGNGRPTRRAVISPSSGGAPFGFAFSRDEFLVVSEVRGAPGRPSPGAVSSYAIADNRTLIPISRSVPTFEAATCWLIDDTRRFVYTTNTGSGSMTTYRVRPTGELRRARTFRMPGGGQSAPIDLARTADGDYIYTLDAGTGTVAMFSRARGSGRLTFLGEVGGLPARAGLQGIAAR